MSTADRALRIALLIDADNAPAEKLDEILTELSTLGEINIRRAYGNWTKHGLHRWQERLLEFAVQPVQQFDYSKGKNATDMAMTVDAMELLYNERPDAFGIVSSDADFTPLVLHLRARGAAVYGFGAAQTPKPFVNACSRFLYLESLGGGVAEGEPNTPVPSESGAAPGAAPVMAGVSQPAPVPASAMPQATDTQEPAQPQPLAAPGVPERPASLRVPGAALRQDRRLMQFLRHAVGACQDEDGWTRVGVLGQQIGNKTSFDARNYGYATLSKLLAATQAFELRDEGTSRIAVRERGAPPLPAGAGG